MASTIESPKKPSSLSIQSCFTDAASTIDNPQRSPAGLASSPGEEAARPTLLKQSSQKSSCLCSPTTHAGSFRCRRHRTAFPSSSSFSALTDLAKNSSDDSPVSA